jgi:hypothetical protein
VDGAARIFGTAAARVIFAFGSKRLGDYTNNHSSAA